MKRRDIVFLVLAGFFIANAVIGEMIGGKLIQIGPFMMSIGIIPWPVVFLSTDLINEYFGKKGVRTITFLTAGLIVYTFIILFAGMSVGSASFSPVNSEQFNAVFGQSLWIIAGSLTAFLLSQLIDVGVFWLIRSRTGHKLIWLRATGSTVVSQLIDTFVVSGIAFWLPGKITLSEYVNVAFTGYVFKFMIALAVTPLIYLGHAAVRRYLGEEESEKLVAEASKATIGES
jgi:uncharacterized integral membrane protein (TIGR00697 family)